MALWGGGSGDNVRSKSEPSLAVPSISAGTDAPAAFLSSPRFPALFRERPAAGVARMRERDSRIEMIVIAAFKRALARGGDLQFVGHYLQRSSVVKGADVVALYLTFGGTLVLRRAGLVQDDLYACWSFARREGLLEGVLPLEASDKRSRDRDETVTVQTWLFGKGDIDFLPRDRGLVPHPHHFNVPVFTDNRNRAYILVGGSSVMGAFLDQASNGRTGLVGNIAPYRARNTTQAIQLFVLLPLDELRDAERRGEVLEFPRIGDDITLGLDEARFSLPLLDPVESTTVTGGSANATVLGVYTQENRVATARIEVRVTLRRVVDTSVDFE